MQRRTTEGTLPLISRPLPDDEITPPPERCDASNGTRDVFCTWHTTFFKHERGTQQTRSISTRGIGHVDWSSQVCLVEVS